MTNNPRRWSLDFIQLEIIAFYDFFLKIRAREVLEFRLATRKVWTSLKWSSFSLKWPEIEAWNEVLKWKFMNFLKNQCLKGQVDHFIKNLELFENYFWLKNIIFVENYSKLWKWKILVIFHEHFWNNKFMVWHSKGLKFIEIWSKMKKWSSHDMSVNPTAHLKQTNNEKRTFPSSGMLSWLCNISHWSISDLILKNRKTPNFQNEQFH